MSATSTALVSTPAKAISNAITSSAKSTTDLATYSAKTAQSALSTPLRATTPASPVLESLPPPSPGSFRHPKLTEIIKRQSRNDFTERNARNVAINFGAVVASFVLGNLVRTSFAALLTFATVANASGVASLILNLLRFLFVTNIAISLRPLIPYISAKDNVNDIALTPSQRSLLGLAPSTQSTPGSVTSAASAFITPPRYRHSSSSLPTSQIESPNTDRRSISANYSSSPLSTSRYTLGFSPTPSQSQSLFRRTASGSPFSPSPSASPLLHKAITQSQNQDLDFGVSRSSFGGSTNGLGLARSQSLREGGRHERRSSTGMSSQEFGMSTPSKRSPGLNYKWLYDKGGKLPRSESMGF